MSAWDQPIVHTPAPWSLLCDDARGRPRCLVVDKDGGEIAAINPHRTAWNENAGLMAESPQMLKVIEIIANATGDTDLEYAQELSQEILIRLKVV